jgi:hypothetical protein
VAGKLSIYRQVPCYRTGHPDLTALRYLTM